MRDEEKDLIDDEEDDLIEEEPRVIEISPLMQVVAALVIATLVAYGIWKFTLGKSSEVNIGEYTTAPELGPRAVPVPEGIEPWIPKAKIYGRDLPPSFTLEELTQADHEKLDEILVSFEEQGHPDPDGQESQLFESLIERGVQVAPKRMFAYVREVENPKKREFALRVLYRRWFDEDFEQAVSSLKLTNEILRREVVESGLVALGREDPEAALNWIVPMERDHFRSYIPDFHRPLFEMWVREDESEALAGLQNLGEGTQDRAEGVKGLVAGKLNSGVEPEGLVSWFDELPSAADRTEAGAMLLQYFSQQGDEEEGEWAQRVRDSDYSSYFQRLQSLNEMLGDAVDEEREHELMVIYRSHPIDDDWGKVMILNQLKNSELRVEMMRELLDGHYSINSASFVFQTYRYPSIAPEQPIQPFRNSLDAGLRAFEEGELEEAREHWITYLSLNPEDQEVRDHLTELSKAKGKWLGEDLELLEGITLPAVSYPLEGDPYQTVIARAQQQVEEALGFAPDFYLADQHPTATYNAVLVGEYPEQPIREGLEKVVQQSGTKLTWEEFGILIIVLRDPTS